MGCGINADIYEHFKNKPEYNKFNFYNYDHVSLKSCIDVQDISKLPHDENSIDYCILCLAMWGENKNQYISEAFRVLQTNGILYIIESSNAWYDKITGECTLKKILKTVRFSVREIDKCKDENKKNKFVFYKCVKEE
jgi:ubiquinone/menaquinone biosynthesis C-methylase UbiE